MTADATSPGSVVGWIGRATSSITLFATFVAVYFWLFAAATALLGTRSWWWLVVGPLLGVPVLAVGFTVWELRGELSKIGAVQVALGVVAVLRDVTALVTLCGVIRLVRDATQDQAASWPDVGGFLWRIVAG